VILDTNALSAVAEGEPGVAAALAEAELVAVPAVVLGEYRFGIAQSRRKVEYERWLTEVFVGYIVLDVNEATSFWYAEIRLELKIAGTLLPSNDAWIAALCRQHRLPVMSRDKHFDRVTGIQRVSW
jgi:predicted nucleic acid-binding protein